MNINHYNELCAQFLGYQITDFEELKFNWDWNWIHEVVEKIEITNRKNDNEYYPYVVTIWKNGCNISDGNNGNILFQNFNPLGKKEAVINTIYEFLKWYYENKN